LEDGIRRIGRILKIKEDVLPALVGELGLIGFLAYFALGLLVGEEEGVVMLPLFNFIIDPVLEAGVVDVLDAARALAQADKGILPVVRCIEADPALILRGVVAFIRDAFHLGQLLQVHALRFKVFLR
jgi:hypothetical protein